MIVAVSGVGVVVFVAVVTLVDVGRVVSSVGAVAGAVVNCCCGCCRCVCVCVLQSDCRCRSVVVAFVDISGVVSAFVVGVAVVADFAVLAVGVTFHLL